MKKLLLFLLTLSGFLANAQDFRRVVIQGQNSYEVRAPRNFNLYPATTTGQSSYTAALASGAFSLTVLNTGCVIPKGTPPPAIAPTCSQTIAAPSWIAGFRYSFDSNHLLTFEGAGNIGTLTFHPVSGGGFPTTNPNNVNISAETPYGYGPLTDQGAYDKQWKLYYTGTSLQVIATQAGTSSTYTYNLTPQLGANQVNLTGTSTTPPTSQTTAVPSWLTALRYSHNGTTLTIQAAGDVAFMSFNTNPVTSWSTLNPDNITISNGIFYGPGTIAVNNYTKQWQVNKAAGPFTITAKNSQGATYSVNFSATTGASNVVLTGTTTSPPTSSVSYAKVLLVGNSITKHPIASFWYNSTRGPWGMDASAASKDYKHLLTAKLQTLNANVDVRDFDDFNVPGHIGEGPYWEANYGNLDGGLSRYDEPAAWGADLIVMRVSENIQSTTNGSGLATHYKQLIDKLKSNNPNATVVLSTSLWNVGNPTQQDVSAIIRGVASERNYPLAELNNTPNGTAGYASHPDDIGHQNITDILWSAIPHSTTTTNPPTSTTSSTAGVPFFETFDYQPITSNSNAWDGYDSRVNNDGPVGKYATLNNGTITVRVNGDQGGTPSFIARNTDGLNRINLHDLGTQNGMTIYRGGPQSDHPGVQVNGNYLQIPNDPIQMGSVFGDRSPVLAMGRDATTVYTKTAMMNWPTQNDLTDAICEQWVKLDGIAAHVYTKITFNRTADKTLYDAYAQEYPTFYTLERLRTLAYKDGNGNLAYRTDQQGQFDINITKPWVALAESASPTAPAIGLWADGMYFSTQWQHAVGNTLPAPNEDLANGKGYSANRMIRQADWNEVWYYHHAFIPGTVAEIQNYAEALPAPRNTIAWKFNTRNGRGLWHVKNATTDGFPTANDGIEITKHGNGQFFLKAPYMAFPASTTNKIYMRYRVDSGFTTPWGISFFHPDQDEIQALNGGQLFNVNTISDGLWHTLEIAMPGTWNGIIQKMQFSNDTAPDGSKIKIAWINTADADPNP